MALNANLNSGHCVSATAAIASFTVAPGSSLPSGTIVWSYSSAPTGGNLKIYDSASTYLDMDITAGGQGYIPFTNGMGGIVDKPGGSLTVTFALASGAGAVVGKLTYIHN